MTRAAIYARYSSDNQDDRSVDDQIALCRDYAARHDLDVVAVFEDRAISGASVHNRPGIQRLLAAANARQFEVVIAESMSRIGRDQEDRAAIRKRLKFRDVQLMTPADGVVTHLVDGVRAVVDSQYIEDLKAATVRGMKASIADGLNAGGRAYGYRPVKGEPGQLAIVADEADVVRRVFRAFINGDSPRTIAGQLNRDRVAAPRKDFWRASTIIGSNLRGHGILLNQIYTGKIVWNRVRMVKHPDTGRRLSRVNPTSEWLSIDVPHLRIIDDAIWIAAQTRRQSRSCAKPRGRIRPRYMLSGLLRCGACGAGMSAKDTDRKGRRTCCSQFMQARSCSNGRGYYLDDIERAVVNGLRVRLGTRDAIAHFVRCYNEAKRRSAHDAIDVRARLGHDLAEAQRILDRMIDAHIRGRITDDEAEARLPQLRTARDRIKSELAVCEAPPKVVTLRPAAVDDYLRGLEDLAGLINGDLRDGDDGLAMSMRKFLDKVTVLPAPAGTPPTIVVQGHLEALLDLSAFPSRSLSGGAMVAGAGLGHIPPTDCPTFSFEAVAA